MQLYSVKSTFWSHPHSQLALASAAGQCPFPEYVRRCSVMNIKQEYMESGWHKYIDLQILFLPHLCCKPNWHTGLTVNTWKGAKEFLQVSAYRWQGCASVTSTKLLCRALNVFSGWRKTTTCNSRTTYLHIHSFCRWFHTKWLAGENSEKQSSKCTELNWAF